MDGLVEAASAGGSALSALRRRLAEQGILWAGPGQPIRHRDGAPAPWAFYSWPVSLDADGLRLAAHCLLQRLSVFGARQLASTGFTGLPLMAACVLEGAGRYRGVAIRDAAKRYLACRQIDGVFDPREPVVIVDDSLSSGTSLQRAVAAVEAAGGHVEGAVVLVHFPHRGGLAWAAAHGMRVESLFDIWRDLGMARHAVPRTPPVTTAAGVDVACPEELSPAALARFVATCALTHGGAPRPPRRLAAGPDGGWDGAGGVFVSVRVRGTEQRLAREGFWHLPDETPAAQADPARLPGDVVRATMQTLAQCVPSLTTADLPRVKFAVTCLSALQRCGVAELDAARAGIVVRGETFPHKRGGALPNTQVFTSEIAQLAQARARNAGLAEDEAFTLFRHGVSKSVEPGEDWLPHGVPEPAGAWWRDAALAERVLRHTQRMLRGDPSEESDLKALAAPRPGFGGVAVRRYRQGLVGYGLALGDTLAETLPRAAAAAADRTGDGHDAATLVVSLLHHAEPLGVCARDYAAWKLRAGRDALSVTVADGGGRERTLLPSALVYNAWSKTRFAEVAGVDGRSACRRWMVDDWCEIDFLPRPMRDGFPVHPDTPTARACAMLLAAWLARAIAADGLPRYWCLPTTGARETHGTAARRIHGLAALLGAGQAFCRPEWVDIATKGLAHALSHVAGGRLCLPDDVGGDLADAVLLAGASAAPALAHRPVTVALARRLSGLLRADGRIAPTAGHDRQDHAFLPGAVLAALGQHAAATAGALPDLGPMLRWYGWHFAALPSWGAAGWLPQGVAAAAADSGCDLAFAAADWACARQLAVNGAFLETLSPDEPSFNTGFVAEGIAAAWSLALRRGDAPRARRYRRAWQEATRFMATLLLRPEDAFCLRDPDAGIGGVRCTPSRADIRVDQVSHWLHALVAGLACECRAVG